MRAKQYCFRKIFLIFCIFLDIVLHTVKIRHKNCIESDSVVHLNDLLCPVTNFSQSIMSARNVSVPKIQGFLQIICQAILLEKEKRILYFQVF